MIGWRPKLSLTGGLFGLALLLCGAAEAGTVKIGVLKFGTVSWELDVIKQHGLDKAAGIDLDIVELANNQATAVALQAGEVDVIVTDWLWVSRQRADGADFTFAPYSTSVGSLMVPGDLPIKESLPISRASASGSPAVRSTRAGWSSAPWRRSGTDWTWTPASRRFSPPHHC